MAQHQPESMAVAKGIESLARQSDLAAGRLTFVNVAVRRRLVRLQYAEVARGQL